MYGLPAGLIAAPSGVKFSRIAGDWFGACALATDGHVWCWGYNQLGETGSATFDPGSGFYLPMFQFSPVMVPGLENVTQLSSGTGGYHYCTIVTGGAVKCWRYNRMGQVGIPPNAVGDAGAYGGPAIVTVAF